MQEKNVTILNTLFALLFYSSALQTALVLYFELKYPNMKRNTILGNVELIC